jgi:hypothetical protein
MTFRMFDFYTRKKPPSATERGTAYRRHLETCIATFGVERASGVSKGLSMTTGSWLSQKDQAKGRMVRDGRPSQSRRVAAHAALLFQRFNVDRDWSTWRDMPAPAAAAHSKRQRYWGQN